MANISDTIVAYKILKSLGTKWTDFEAYELGLINKDGERLRSPENAKEREAYSSYYKMIFNMKRLLQRFIGSNPSINKLATLFLLKEGQSEETARIVVSGLELPTDTKNLNESDCELILKQFVNQPY